MPFQVSPGVNVSEIDLTTVVPAVSTTEGALAGVFRWGPVGERVLVDSESNLTARFGKPTNHNAETFFTAANFLSYGNKLYVTRIANTTSNNTATVCRNAVANVANIANWSSANNTANSENALYIIKNDDHFTANAEANIEASGDQDVKYIAKYPGVLGNSLKISVCPSSDAYSYNVFKVLEANNEVSGANSIMNATVGSANLAFRVLLGSGTVADSAAKATAMLNNVNIGDYIEVGNSSIGLQYMRVVAKSAVADANSTGGDTSNTESRFTLTCEDSYSLSENFSANTIARKWEYWNVVDTAPGISTYQSNFGGAANVNVDELHVVVSDEDGAFTGVPGTVLEVFGGLSRATDAKTEDGSTNYYKTVINQNSNYVWVVKDLTGAVSNTATNIANSSATVATTLSFTDGTDAQDENNVAVGTVLGGYDLYASAEDVDVSLLLTGVSRGGTNGEQIANYLIDNIAEKRKDCVVFVSPQKADLIGDPGDEISNIVTFRNSLRSTSYAVLDSGYKYQYDKYNDLYRWIPLNGDIAGLCVRTDDTRDPWFSPAGFNRGQIKNIVKLAYNPRQADRDILYKAGVNPVVTFPGQGTVLYGDKTLLAKPSAFDRINVRRLFIVLEKAIATAAKFTLFEFNDDFTRAQFRNLVEPFLRDVQGRRGIYDFLVVCDTTNNTGEVIDRNEFIGDIYIKPAKSINFIQLNFVAVRTGVEFSEVVGQF
jgi:phage tail sheath protein FI